MSSIRVLLADDHPVVRSGIRAMLEREPDIAVIAEASDGKEALRLTAELKPDVLAPGHGMPMAGDGIAGELRALSDHFSGAGKIPKKSDSRRQN